MQSAKEKHLVRVAMLSKTYCCLGGHALWETEKSSTGCSRGFQCEEDRISLVRQLCYFLSVSMCMEEVHGAGFL